MGAGLIYSYLKHKISYKNPNNETRIAKLGLVGYYGVQPSLPSHHPGNVASRVLLTVV
jgi:hypothetical protein